MKSNRSLACDSLAHYLRGIGRIPLLFGLGVAGPLTLAEIGRQINMPRDRVRQLKTKAISNLQLMTGHALV